jgi:indole-3-glycerol phosphate synthase
LSLDRILSTKKKEVAERKQRRSFSDLRRSAEERGGRRAFRESLMGEGISLIAEIKKASPSAGLIRVDLDVREIAEAYTRGGASALSVLTDETYFGGSLDHLAEAREATVLPILRKDFVIDEYQIAEAGASGADAFLLIARALSGNQLSEFLAFGREIGLDALVEIHQGKELDDVVAAGAELVGVNNRDLTTFETSLERSLELGRRLPENVVRVSESGIAAPEDLRLLSGAGFHAVLVGEALMRSGSPEKEVRRLLGSVE